MHQSMTIPCQCFSNRQFCISSFVEQKPNIFNWRRSMAIVAKVEFDLRRLNFLFFFSIHTTFHRIFFCEKWTIFWSEDFLISCQKYGICHAPANTTHHTSIRGVPNRSKSLRKSLLGQWRHQTLWTIYYDASCCVSVVSTFRAHTHSRVIIWAKRAWSIRWVINM